jgi:hypothetical protein
VPNSGSGNVLVIYWLSLSDEIATLVTDDQIILLKLAGLALESSHQSDEHMAGHASLIFKLSGCTCSHVGATLVTLGSFDAFVNVNRPRCGFIEHLVYCSHVCELTPTIFSLLIPLLRHVLKDIVKHLEGFFVLLRLGVADGFRDLGHL